MAFLVNPTEDNVFTAFATVLNQFGFYSASGIVPVIQGQVNRVPEPANLDFLIMWPLGRPRLSLDNPATYLDSQFTGSITSNVLTVTAILNGAVPIGTNLWFLNQTYTCTVLSQTSGPPGGIGVYAVSPLGNQTSQTIYGGIAVKLQPYEFIVQCDVHGPYSGDNCHRLTTLWRDYFAVEAFIQTGYDIAPLYADDPKQMPFINAEQQFEERYSVTLHAQVNETVTVPQQFADELNVTIFTPIL